MSLLLLVKPLEPLSLSKRQITGPSFYQSLPLAFPFPQPTTILGALGNALGIQVSNVRVENLEDVKTVSAKIMEKLECKPPFMQGPLLMVETPTERCTRFYAPMRPDLFVDLNHLGKAVVRKGANYYASTGICRDEELACIKSRFLVHVGVSLKRTGGQEDKTVKLGYMYKYPVVVYSDAKSGKTIEASIVYVINCKQPIHSTVARVGGEGRVAELKTLEDTHGLSSKLRSPLSELEKGVYLSVNYVPLIPSKLDTLELSTERVYGLEFAGMVGSIVGMLQAEPSPPKIVIEKLGLGYSEVAKRRRPTVLALPPGTIITVTEAISKDTIEPIKTLWNIGYTTLLLLE